MCMYGYAFLSLSAWNFAWRFGLISDRFSPILGDSPKDGRVLGINRAPYGGICFLLKHLFPFRFTQKDNATLQWSHYFCVRVPLTACSYLKWAINNYNFAKREKGVCSIWVSAATVRKVSLFVSGISTMCLKKFPPLNSL